MRYLRGVVRAVEWVGSQRRLIGATHDITEQRHAEHEAAALLAASDAVVDWGSLETGAPQLLRGLCEAMELDVGAFWVPVEGPLACRIFWHRPSVDVAGFEAASRELTLQPGAALAGKAYARGEPLVVANVLEEGVFFRRKAAAGAGLRGAAAVPAVHDDEVLAVVELFGRDQLDATDGLVRCLEGLSRELGQFLAGRKSELEPPLLTAREHEVLQLAATGLTGPGIARRLDVSRDTVKTHFRHIYEKLNVSSRTRAVAVGLRRGILE